MSLKNKVWVIDIDGVLADSSHRGIPNAIDGADKYFANLEDDKPFDAMRNLVNVLYKDYKIILLTGRNERFRIRTSRWLVENGIPYNQLHMRPDGHGGKVSDFKGKVLDSLIGSGYIILGYFEDNPLSVERAKELGVPSVCVYSGFYEHWDPEEVLPW